MGKHLRCKARRNQRRGQGHRRWQPRGRRLRQMNARRRQRQQRGGAEVLRGRGGSSGRRQQRRGRQRHRPLRCLQRQRVYPHLLLPGRALRLDRIRKAIRRSAGLVLLRKFLEEHDQVRRPMVHGLPQLLLGAVVDEDHRVMQAPPAAAAEQRVQLLANPKVEVSELHRGASLHNAPDLRENDVLRALRGRLPVVVVGPHGGHVQGRAEVRRVRVQVLVVAEVPHRHVLEVPGAAGRRRDAAGVASLPGAAGRRREAAGADSLPSGGGSIRKRGRRPIVLRRGSEAIPRSHGLVASSVKPRGGPAATVKVAVPVAPVAVASMGGGEGVPPASATAAGTLLRRDRQWLLVGALLRVAVAPAATVATTALASIASTLRFSSVVGVAASLLPQGLAKRGRDHRCRAPGATQRASAPGGLLAPSASGRRRG
mmetsp:Transcript_63556/g.182522  ORF Transcript_63556/g.182522 Transcript_63556/m.182522 type:complete len:427 (-) Transcript_63556:152-1432(-)